MQVAIIGALFFVFGFVTWANAALIPYLKIVCGLSSDAEALLVTFAFYMAYFFLALPASFILRRTGYKRGMALGLAVMAVGSASFILAHAFTVFLFGLFVQGMGLALLQTAANPYAAGLGAPESAARRIAVMGICNKVAGALSPMLLGALLLSEPTQANLQRPYVVITGVLLLLAALIWLSPLPELREEEGKGEGTRRTQLYLGVVALFLYVGAEVMAGDVIGPYARALGMSLEETKHLTSYTLWAMVVGYVIGVVLIPRVLSQRAALAWSAVISLALVVIAAATKSILAIALLGVGNALMWPAIFPLAIAGLGRFTRTGSALLIMGVSGGAVIPQIYARVPLPPQWAFLCTVLPCYAFILYFALRRV